MITSVITALRLVEVSANPLRKERTMAKITWDATGERNYEIGVDRGVLYHLRGDRFTNGVAWNGLTKVEDSSDGRDATKLYSGGIRVRSEFTLEEFSGKITCYTFPDSLEDHLGETEFERGVYARQQRRAGLFGFSYRSLIGNDTDGSNHGYKLHLIYNMRVTDFERTYSSLNNSLDLGDVEISFESYPFDLETFNYDLDPVSEIVFDSRYVKTEILKRIEEILYGEKGTPRMPTPDEIYDIVSDPGPQIIPDQALLYPYEEIYPATDLYPY